MKSINLSGNAVELDNQYSTTRRVIKINQSTGICRISNAKNTSSPPEGANSNEEGGLRTQGYFKRSYSDKPLISIITVVYNGEQYLEQAIQSVVNQTYDNVEYIIIDGGSTDATLDIIKKYDGVIDYWISELDNGVYDAMNKGIKLFQGDYVLFMGCDDSLYDVLHKVVGLFNKKSLSYYGSVVLSKNNKKYDGRFYSLKLFLKNIPHQAIFYSRLVFDEFDFNVKYVAVADYALNLKIFSNEKYGFKYIPYTVANYNNEIGLSSTLIDNAFSLDKPALIKKHYSMLLNMIYILIRFLFRKKSKNYPRK